MAIYYIDNQNYTFYNENIQNYIDDGYGTPGDDNIDDKPKHIYYLIEPEIFKDSIGSSNELFYVKPRLNWSKILAQKLFQNDIARVYNNIYIDQLNNSGCDFLINTIEEDIESNGYSSIIINNSDVFIPNHIHITKTC